MSSLGRRLLALKWRVDFGDFVHCFGGVATSWVVSKKGTVGRGWFVVLEELDTVELQQNDKEKLVILFVVASLVDSVVSLVCFDSKKATSVICMGFLLDDNSRFSNMLGAAKKFASLLISIWNLAHIELPHQCG